MSRAPAHPLRRRFRSIWPISDLSADPMVMLPARKLGANHVSLVPESRWPLARVETSGQPNSGVGRRRERPSPNGGVVARKELKVYFFLPHARPVPVKSWCCASWFVQWSLTRRPLRPWVSQSPAGGASRGDLRSAERRGLETIAEQRLEPAEIRLQPNPPSAH